tara:strand:- start:110 stop:430 length:321 start_codon:yes stop_codon:yes gene_type:complete
MNETGFLNIKNMTKEEIKNFIENDIPKMNLNHKLYIYEAVGSILFRNKWETVWKMFDTSSQEINLEFIQVLCFTNLYNIKEKTDIFNIIFQKVLNLLVNDPLSKRL